MKADTLLKTHVFYVDPKERGGNSLAIHTDMFSNGDPGPNGVYWNQKIVLHSICNRAVIELCGTILTPDRLRQLANELEKAQIEAEQANK
jgi:hypothetical protein